MLSRKIPKLKLWFRLELRSKGGSNTKQHSISRKLLSKYLLPGIPVLSIFALVGIISLGVTLPSNGLTRLFGIDKLFGLDSLLEDSNKAYAEEGIIPLADTSASLTVDDGAINDKVDTAYNNFAYASHKITVEANNIESYTLTLAPNKTLTGPSVITGAGGKTPAQMTGASNYFGYAWTDTTANPTTATYDTLDTAKTLAGPPVNAATHSVSGSKQLVFGAKFGDGAASGTYSARATLSMVATPYAVVNYSITYNTNGGSVIANTTATDDTGAASKNLTISSTTPTLAGYKFAGWATTSGGAVAYQPGGNITLQASSPAITLYAVWQLASFPSTITTMQGMTADICASVGIGTSKTLTDVRDNNTYTIVKLSDNNCWMTQNLRLKSNTTLNSTTSDVSFNYTLPDAKVIGSSDTGTDKMVNASNNTYGAYYTWRMATAGSYASTNTKGDIAPSSICPKGWHLPAGSDISGDYLVLINKYSGKVGTWSANSLTAGYWLGANSTSEGGAFFSAAGYFDAGTSLMGSGTASGYWTNTRYGGTTNRMSAYRLSIGSYSASQSFQDDYYSNPVRCVAYSS